MIRSHPYNNSTNATGSINNNAAVLSGVVASESADVSLVAAGAAGVYASKDVGSRQVTLSGYDFNVTGQALKSNYLFTQPSPITGNITAVPLTVVGVTITDHLYNRSTNATGSINNNAAVLSGGVASEAA